MSAPRPRPLPPEIPARGRATTTIWLKRPVPLARDSRSSVVGYDKRRELPQWLVDALDALEDA
jgi:hypothetical protein